MAKKKARKTSSSEDKNSVTETIHSTIEELKKDQQEVDPAKTQVVTEKMNTPKPSVFSKIKLGYKNLGSKKRLLLWGAVGLVSSVAAFSLLIFLFKLDSIIFPSSLSGNVIETDVVEKQLEGAKVCVGNKCSTTDANGNYKINGVSYGKREIKVEKDGYQTLEKNINLKRGANTYNLVLKIEGYKDFKGTLKVNGAQLVIEDIRLLSGSEEYSTSVKSDGSFIFSNVKVNSDKVILSFPSYKDKEYTFDLKSSEINLGNIIIEPASEVTFNAIDWLSLEKLSGIKAVLKSGVGTLSVTHNDGVYRVNDLTVGVTGILQLQLDNYLLKELNLVKLTQGTKVLGDVEMVREGKVVYVSNRKGNDNIYIANYDGSEEKLLTGNKGDSYAPYYDVAAGTVTFISNRDGYKDAHDNKIDLVYKVNISTGKIVKVSKNKYETTDNRIGLYNLKAGKRVYYREHPSYPKTWQYFYGNIDGTDTKQIIHSANYIGDVIISDNGNLIMYREDPQDNTKDGVYLYNPKSGTKNIISADEDNIWSNNPITFSPDNNIGLIERNINGDSDLYVRIFDKAETKRITDNTSTENYAAFSNDSSKVSYISFRDNNWDLYVVDIETRKETQLTQSGDIGSQIWMGDLIFYTHESELRVVDPTKPAKTQLVSNKAHISNYKTINESNYWD